MKASLTINIWTEDPNAPEPEDFTAAFEPHVEHVLYMLRKGNREGDIVDRDFKGWWFIDDDAVF